LNSIIVLCETKYGMLMFVFVCAMDGNCSANLLRPCQLCSVHADHHHTLSADMCWRCGTLYAPRHSHRAHC